MNSAAPTREITVRVVLLSMLLSVVLMAANAYLGLLAGLTVSGSIPAAVASLAILGAFRATIHEHNLVQTAASTGEALAGGVIFTLPALVLLGVWTSFEYWPVVALAGLGGLLGVLFSAPLRRALVVEQQLPYPEGTATAAVLRAGTSADAGMRALLIGGIVSALAKFAGTGLRLWGATAEAAVAAGKSIWYVGIDLSPALLGVGFIVGLRIGILTGVGGALAWYVAMPIYSEWFLVSDAPMTAALQGLGPIDAAYEIWGQRIRYLGVGAMLIGGVWTLFEMRGAVLTAIAGGLGDARGAAGRVAWSSVPASQRDIPMSVIATGIALSAAPLYFVYAGIVGGGGPGLLLTAVMLVTGFMFSAVGAYLTGIVGSSNMPLSGVTIATVFMTALLLLALSLDRSGPAGALMVGAVVCCAASLAGDNMQDLKTGYLIGATPWKQQVMQLVGAFAAVAFAAPILNLLLSAYGFGVQSAERPDALPAPQATLMAAVASGVFTGNLPWGMVGAGVVTGALLIVADLLFDRRGWGRIPVLAVAVGIYLPLELSVCIAAGGVLAWFCGRGGKHGFGDLTAAGLIAGEALVGIALAVPIVMLQNPEPFGVPDAWRPGAGVGLLMLAGIAWLLYRSSRGGTGPHVSAG